MELLLSCIPWLAYLFLWVAVGYAVVWFVLWPLRQAQKQQRLEHQQDMQDRMAALDILRDRAELLARDYDRPITQAEIERELPWWYQVGMAVLPENDAGQRSKEALYAHAKQQCLEKRAQEILLGLPAGWLTREPRYVKRE